MPTDDATQPAANPWDLLPAGEVTTKASKNGELRIYINGDLVDTQNVNDWVQS